MVSNSNLQKPIEYLRPAQYGRVTKWLCGGLQIRIRGFKSLPALLIFSFILLLIFLSSKSSANILINEVMYNPVTNDNYNEWIELFNPTNKPINISNWTIDDNSAKDYLEGDFDNGNGTTIIPPKGYAIIADRETKIYENFSIPIDAIRLYVDDSSIGNGLGNNGDKLILKNKTEEIIDAIEWGNDYSDISGMPADIIGEGFSLSRYQNIDTDDSSIDFYEGIIPTPGSGNTFVNKPNLDIELHPFYIPKIQNKSEYSLPFSIKVNMSNYVSNQTYELKTYIVGELYSSWPASQTWDGTLWKYSNYYTSVITTDENGNWSGWQHLRFKKSYQEYEKNIKENNSAYLKVKIKNDNISDEISKKVYLLDMDNSTSNATLGGYAIGIIHMNNTFIDRKIAIIENKSGVITGIYITENNKIDENLISIPGYYKLTSPVDSNYTIKFLNSYEKVEHTIYDVTIKHGKYGVDIDSKETYFLIRKSEALDVPLIVKNIGDFNDTIDLKIEYFAEGWHAILEKEKISLSPKKAIDVNLHITPFKEHGCISGTLTVSATSEKDLGEFDEITFQLEILAPDLIIKNIKIYNENGEETKILGEGEIIKIKAFFKNIGNENATDASVNFYYDLINQEHFIGSKSYDSIGKYQKYPLIKWDTKDICLGKHTIYIIADKDDTVDEQDENNNILSIDIDIFDTFPNNVGKRILITDIYYHSRPGLFNEFISIYNPTLVDFNISGWYLTNEPFEIKTEQTKIEFPTNTILRANSKLILSENASSYKWEIGKNPHFEYNYDSNKTIPQMISSKKFIMSNKGKAISLKDTYNHTIDFVTYGNDSYFNKFWTGASIPFSGVGVILRRNLDKDDRPIDTNTSFDWINPRRYGIGQSDFPYANISFTGKITTFVSPDCSFQTIVQELRNANDSIYLNIYEFTDPFLCDELIDALLRNVSVYIFLEGSPIGGISDEEKLILYRIANYGGNIRFIINDVENNVYARYIFNHAKYLIIDNKTVIVESCNWAKTGIPKNPTYGNREWGIIIKNNFIAQYFLDVFLEDWDVKRCDSYSFDEMNLFISSDYYIDDSVYMGSYEPQFESESFMGNFSIIPVLSPDNSYKAICNMIESSNESIYVQQLYIYKEWNNRINPFVEKLVNKARQNVDVKVILNYNPNYEGTNEKCNITKQYLEENGIDVKFIYTNWSYFSNVHNKGLIVDNKSVLISSINWNQNSVTCNREIGVIIRDNEVAKYYTDVFFYDWNLQPPKLQKQKIEKYVQADYKNTIYIIIIFTMTFALIARDWRKRQWT